MSNVDERIEWHIKTPQDAIKFCGLMMADIVAGRIKPGRANKIMADFGRRLKEVEGRFHSTGQTMQSLKRLNELEREYQQILENQKKLEKIKELCLILDDVSYDNLIKVKELLGDKK